MPDQDYIEGVSIVVLAILMGIAGHLLNIVWMDASAPVLSGIGVGYLGHKVRNDLKTGS